MQRYTNDFHDVMDVFNILRPSIEPCATAIVEQLVIKKIMDNGYAAKSTAASTGVAFSEDHPYEELRVARLAS